MGNKALNWDGLMGGEILGPRLLMTVLTKRFNASLLKVEPFCLTSSRRNACYKGKYIWGVITAKMRCGIAILLWSFRLHNNWCYVLSIWHCKFHSSILYFFMYLHILLCIVFCYSNIWHFRLLWWCFALSTWQCKVLWAIVQFYILCTYVCYHPRLGYFRNFCILFCVPVLWSVSACEVVLCLRHILHGTQWAKIRWPSRGNGYHSQRRCHFLPSAV